MKENTKEQQHIFTNQMLRSLLIPVIFEQVLNSLMGTVDTMMVSNVGSAAISAVSLVDSINVLVIQAFSALAAGGAIICSQYIGQKNHEMANKSARSFASVRKPRLWDVNLQKPVSRTLILRTPLKRWREEWYIIL